MNSNWKLLSAGLLVAALAGCGGSGGEVPEPTDEELCQADGGIFEDGTCKSADDLRGEGAKEEGEKRDQEDADEQAAADAAAAQKMAANLFDVLSSDGDSMTSVADPSTIMRVATGYDDADMMDSVTTSIMGKKFSEQYNLTDGVFSISDTSGNTMIMGDAFSMGAQKDHTNNMVDEDGNAYFGTPGSYHGVMGTFKCTGACTSTIPADNEGLNLGGMWTFTPSNPDDPVTDANGLQYGWWATETDGKVTAAHAFYVAKSLTVMAGGLPVGHGGTATYKGGAMGQYAIHRGMGGMNDSGSFTADAELTATFGSEAEISGTIDGFVGADGESRNWEVMLKSLSTHSKGVYSGMGNVVWTIGEDSSGDMGGWEVTALGNGAKEGAPPAVAGGFQAEHGIANGHMIGAFGAELE